ncbi:MAG: hypothetical protein ACERK1_02115 [Anaerolineales bacterium]
MDCVVEIGISIATLLLGAIGYRLKKLRDRYPHEPTPSKTTGEIVKDGAIGGLFGALVGLFIGYTAGMTFFSVYRFNKPVEVDMIIWMTLIALLAWLLGGSIGGLLADRIILENDYPRKRSTLALGGFFTAFAICIASSIFLGIVNTISIL